MDLIHNRLVIKINMAALMVALKTIPYSQTLVILINTLDLIIINVLPQSKDKFFQQSPLVRKVTTKFLLINLFPVIVFGRIDLSHV